MSRLVRNAALLAALTTVAVAVWRDYGALITVKRAAVAYLATFFVAGGLTFLAHIALQAHEPPPPPEPERKPRRHRKRPPRPDDVETPPVNETSPDAAATAAEPAATPEPTATP